LLSQILQLAASGSKTEDDDGFVEFCGCVIADKYNDVEEYYIEKLQHAAWWAFVSSCDAFNGHNPFEYFRHYTVNP
jgi:hypothetical protein